ncbi:MAG: UvrD-helicase domain-containing protein [Nitrospirae bacterium]|nr:UvrD-helicase domain-containing protein [Nitrospirota bacterium]
MRGKTDFVSKQIAYLIYKNNAKPENIVAITFTERAAEELKFRIRQKIRELIGHQSDIGDMYVGTIHGFCFKILQEFIPQYRVYDVLDEGKRYAFVSSIKNEQNFNLCHIVLKRIRKKPSWDSSLQELLISSDITEARKMREGSFMLA